MGWEIAKREGSGFLLKDEKRERFVVFDSEADSHEAGEAVRLHLGRPRVSELVAQKEAVDRDLVAMRAELSDLRRLSAADVQAAREHADAIETRVLGVDKLEISGELMRVKAELAAQKLETERERAARENIEGQLAKL